MTSTRVLCPEHGKPLSRGTDFKFCCDDRHPIYPCATLADLAPDDGTVEVDVLNGSVWVTDDA